jgi:DHA1 family solute carrier family 18 vesicular amine transporter 1/2
VLPEQLGLAMTGMTVGLLLGAPVGGALYGAFGFRAPFIFGIIITFLDLIGRLLIIERKDALKYGWDPTAEMIRQEEKRLEQKEQRTEEKRVAKERKAAKEDDKRDIEKTVGHTSKDAIIDEASAERTADAAPTLPPSVGAPGIAPEQFVAEQHEHRNDLELGHLSRPPSSQSTVTDQQPRISMLRAVISLGKSPRAMTAYMNTLILGYAISIICPVLVPIARHTLTGVQFVELR